MDIDLFEIDKENLILNEKDQKIEDEQVILTFSP
jgi:hypothetical protein